MGKAAKPKPKHSIGYHNDGSIWSKGQTLDGKMHGYWEFFRKGDGAIMRSGSFDRGEQTGEWTTYDRDGKVFKVTQTKPAGAAKAAGPKAKGPKPKAPARRAVKKK
jgi:hypothetical protein